jgi:hypothetical protein
MDHDQAIETKFPMRYVLQELTPADRDEFEEHLADCSNCMNEVWMATAFAANAKEGFRAEGAKQTAAERTPWWRWRPFPALAFSAGLNLVLAAIVGYGLLGMLPSLRNDIAVLDTPGAVEISSVHGVVRDASGGVPTVVASGPVAVLSFDLPQHYEKYQYSITNVAGGRPISGEVRSTANEYLYFKVPVSRFAPGNYRVTMTGVTGNVREELGSCLLQVPKQN